MKPFRILAMLCLALFAAASVGLAKEEKVALGDVPRAVMAAVEKRFPDAKPTGAGKEEEDGQVIFEVQLTEKSRKIDVSLSADGTIREIERQIASAELPAAVARVLAEKYAKAKLQFAETVVLVKDGKDVLDCYEVKLAAGAQVIEVKITADGKVKHEEVQTEANEES